MQSAGGPIQRSGTELENTVFQKARSRDDYMNYVTKLILHCKSEFLDDVRSLNTSEVKIDFVLRCEE